MNEYLKDAMDIKEDIIANRRYIHQNAEVGFDLPKTKSYVKSKLISYGYSVKELGGGLVSTIGRGSPVILLRADMDALPMMEESGEPFASDHEACHSCGHDGHTSMLLGAAQILKMHEDEIKGTIKLMFQPGEETLKGSQQMIDAGVLENPKVDVAMGFHLNFGPMGDFDLYPGNLAFCKGKAMISGDEFLITVRGKMAHGSNAFMGVSAVNAAAMIVNAFNQVVALEIACDESAVLTTGSLHSGGSANVIPEEAVIRGHFRSFDVETREFLRQRVEEIVDGISKACRVQFTIEYVASVTPLINDEKLSDEMEKYCKEIFYNVQHQPPIKGSEDFANMCRHVPVFFANV